MITPAPSRRQYSLVSTLYLPWTRAAPDKTGFKSDQEVKVNCEWHGRPLDVVCMFLTPQARHRQAQRVKRCDLPDRGPSLVIASGTAFSAGTPAPIA